MYKETERERETRHIDRRINGRTGRHTDNKKAGRQMYRLTDGQKDREREREREDL